MGKIRAFNAKALERSPEDWISIEDEYFPANKRPWTDLYTSNFVEQAGKIIGLSNERQLLELRLLLAYACEDCFRNFKFIGGAAAEGKKKIWRSKAIKDAKRLRSTLKKSDDNFSTFTSRSDGSDKIRIHTTNSLQKVVGNILTNIDEFVAFLECADRALERSKSEDTQRPTSHRRYLQYAVDQFASVFMHFRPANEVKRNTSGNKTVGVFPDFIREVAPPTLAASYVRYAEKPDRLRNLNDQIQKAVKKASFLAE